ncbi:MAG: hypothetical protein ACFFBH_09100 [Promethearchaeota archaeon]
MFFNVLFSILIGLFVDLQLSNVTLADLTSPNGGISLYTTEGGNFVATIIILIGFL